MGDDLAVWCRAYSEDNLNFCRGLGVVLIMRGKKNPKDPNIRELKPKYFFNTTFFPENWSDKDLLKMYAIRPRIEEGNAQGNGQYNGKRMNIRGKKPPLNIFTLIYILMLLEGINRIQIESKGLDAVSNCLQFIRCGKMERIWLTGGTNLRQSLMLEGMIKGPDIVPDDFMGI